jgi:hypothetical protein
MGEHTTREESQPSPKTSSTIEFASAIVNWKHIEAARVLSTFAKLFAILFFTCLGVGRLVLGRYTDYAFPTLGLISGGLLVTSLLLGIRGKRGDARIRLSGQILQVSGEVSIRIHTSCIASAFVTSRPANGISRPTLQLYVHSRLREWRRRGFGDSLQVSLPDAELGQQLVERLGFGVNARRTTINLAHEYRRLVHIPVALVAVFAAFAFVNTLGRLVAFDESLEALYQVPAVSVVCLLLYEVLKVLLRPPHLTIGLDGLLLVHGTKRMFLPRATICDVSVDQRNLTIHRRDGSDVRLRSILMDARCAEAARRMLSHNSDVVQRFCETVYAPAGRNIQAWREYLNRGFQPDYRNRALSPEEASTVLGNPHISPNDRIAAAIALRVAGMPGERIRTIGNAVADDELSSELESIAEGDDRAVDRAVRRMLRDPERG